MTNGLSLERINFHGLEAVRYSTPKSSVTAGINGGRLLSCNLEGRELVYFDPAKTNRSTHPCGPIFGGLSREISKDGQYLDGETIRELPQHGFLRDSNWIVNTEYPSALEMYFEHNRNCYQ